MPKIKKISLGCLGFCVVLSLAILFLSKQLSRKYLFYDELKSPVNSNRLISVCKDIGDGFFDKLVYRSFVSSDKMSKPFALDRHASEFLPVTRLGSPDLSVVWSKDGSIVAYENIVYRYYPYPFYGKVYVFAYDFRSQHEINPKLQFRQKSQAISNLLVERGGTGSKVKPRRFTIWFWQQKAFEQADRQ